MHRRAVLKQEIVRGEHLLPVAGKNGAVAMDADAVDAADLRERHGQRGGGQREIDAAERGERIVEREREDTVLQRQIRIFQPRRKWAIAAVAAEREIARQDLADRDILPPEVERLDGERAGGAFKVGVLRPIRLHAEIEVDRIDEFDTGGRAAARKQQKRQNQRAELNVHRPDPPFQSTGM